MYVWRKLLVTFLSVLFCASVFAQGTLIDDTFYSEALEGTQNVDVYLPEGYNPDDTDTRYPVVYFLHGGSLNHNSYPELMTVLDQITNHPIDPVILVKPNGYADTWLGLGWWANSEYLGMYEDYIINDLINYIDTTYNTLAERGKRCIMGHSAGGYGAFMLAARYPETFCAVASHTGIVHLGLDVEGTIPLVLSENGGSGPYDPSNGIMTQIFFTYAQAFTPDLENPPYYETLCIDNEGNMIDEVYAEWNAMDPAYLVTQYPDDLDFGIYMDCGSLEPGYYMLSDAMADTLDAYEMPYFYEIFEGGHMNMLPDRYPISFAFLDSIMLAGTPHTTSASITPMYAAPNTGEVSVQANVSNFEGHSIEVHAQVTNEEGDVGEPFQLFDDGEHNDGDADDGVYGGTWNLPAGECYYWINIRVDDLDTDSYHIKRNIATFTSAGPVVVDSLSIVTTIPPLNPGEVGFCQLTLLNSGAEASVPDVTVMIFSDDPMVFVRTSIPNECDDLPAGIAFAHRGYFRIEIDEECEPETDLEFTASVSSDGYPYWTDTFTVHVYAESDVASGEAVLPQQFALHAPFPNPFNPSTLIQLDIPEPSLAHVSVYNLLGEQVAVLANGYLTPGNHNMIFDGTDLSSGIYFVRAFVPGHMDSMQRVVLMK